MYRQLAVITSLLVFCTAMNVFAQGSPNWQQRVHYKMDVTLLADNHKMTGTQWLTYTNNSPDTLQTVFYHLYFNAFQPSSMMAERNRNLPDPDGRVVPRIWNLSDDEIGYHHVLSLTQNGVRLSHDVNDTVMQVELNEPVPPGTSTTIKMKFQSQVPLQTRRNGRDSNEGVDFSMSQWYPKIAAYDERGWHADPYVGREFYAPFGTFEVSIKAPANFVLGGTGVVQNPDVVGHGYQTDDAIKMSYSAADSLTWMFKAENVHDFAWVADTEYIHEKIQGEDGVTYHLLYLPDVAQSWSNMSQQVPQLIQSLGRMVGTYPYPQFTVAQAGDGGMEYPMVNFITGRRSPMSLLGVTAHEAAHEWFYAVLGSNEADYSWMDEGFTQYISTRAMNDVLGRPAPSFGGALQGIVTVQKLGLSERLNTPSDWFETNLGYGVAAYSGGLMVADMLGHVMSDEVRDEWLKEYFRRYKFKHPNPYDVEKVAEDVSGLRLDWFFEQLTNTTRQLDYGVGSIASFRGDNGWTSTIGLERKNQMVMPVDVRLVHRDGTESYATVPLGIMQGHKPVADGWTVGKPWNWTFTEYNLIVESTSPVVAAEVDPFHRTPDFN
ncbi:MAG: M1 family metallopeptidase, partial [Rhodothermales bacterium]|nr:M1 family metallopeptidase [Rhodothermales bacterium]